jgi:hypothetical protein
MDWTRGALASITDKAYIRHFAFSNRKLVLFQMIRVIV